VKKMELEVTYRFSRQNKELRGIVGGSQVGDVYGYLSDAVKSGSLTRIGNPKMVKKEQSFDVTVFYEDPEKFSDVHSTLTKTYNGEVQSGQFVGQEPQG
jgi:hypothetical protein